MTWTVPAFLHSTMRALYADALNSALQPLTGRDDTILVVLQLAGGNDGLNTVIPWSNDFYYTARPRLAALIVTSSMPCGSHVGSEPFPELSHHDLALFVVDPLIDHDLVKLG